MTAATPAHSAHPRVTNTLATLRGLVGRKIKYETKQGTVRTGRLTSLKTSTILIGGSPYEIPTELTCDRDETDATALLDLIRIDVIPASE